MTYLFLYVVGITLIWWTYRVGWLEALKTVIKVIVPSALIILFNIKAGRLLFKSSLADNTWRIELGIFLISSDSFPHTYLNLSLIHISEPTRPY